MNFRRFLSLRMVLALCLVFYASTLLAFSGTSGIQFFKGSWSEVKAKAEAENKIIFVETYASYCAPCRLMEKEVFSSASVADFFNENFINYKVDLQTIAGDLFKMEYSVELLPDLLFVNYRGDVVHRERGSKDRAAVLAMAENALILTGRGDNNEPSFSIREMTTLYENGYQTASFLYDYAYALKQVNQPYLEVVNAYIDERRGGFAEARSSSHMQLIYDFSADIQTKAADILIRDPDLYFQRFEKGNVQTKLANAVVQGAADAAASGDEALFKKCLTIIDRGELADPEILEFRVKSIYYGDSGNWKKYTQAVNERIKTGVVLTPTFYNSSATRLFKNTDSRRLLKKARKWAEQSVRLQDAYYNNLMLTEILSKLGKKKKAKKVARHAIWIAKRKGNDFSRAQQLIKSNY